MNIALLHPCPVCISVAIVSFIVYRKVTKSDNIKKK